LYCDLIKSRNRVDVQILNEAIKGYVKMKTADYTLLIEYARKLRVVKLIKNYLEVLL
jgi:hypothetical protein